MIAPAHPGNGHARQRGTPERGDCWHIGARVRRVSLEHESRKWRTVEIFLDATQNFHDQVGVMRIIVRQVARILDDRHLRYGGFEKLALIILDADVDHSLTADTPHMTLQLRHIHVRSVGVLLSRHECQSDRIDAADDAAVTPGGHIATRPVVALLDVTRSKDLLFLDHDGADR